MKTITNEKTMTTKELADVLGVDVKTIQRAVESLDINVERVGSSHTMIFTEKQATEIKLELQNHSKVAKNGFNTLTISNDLEMLLMQQKLSEYQTLRIKELQAENEKQKQQLIEQAPKVEMYDTSMYAENTYSMNEVAKILKLPYGNKTLFNFLRCNEILDNNNIPYERFIKQGLFKVVVKPVKISNQIVNKTVTRVTQKGADYILKLIKKIA